MPLNSERLPKDVQNYLHELPLDDECKIDIYYQTKINIYEEKCKDCGFSKIILNTATNDGRRKTHIFEGVGAVNKANNIISKFNCDIIRTCTYPNDIMISNDKEKLPTLTEIVSNTCQFWNIDKLNIPTDNETAFIEEETLIKMESLVVGENIIKERLSKV